MKKNRTPFIAGLIILIGALVMFMAAAPGSTAAELSLKEIVNSAKKYKGEYISFEALLIEDSIKWNADKIELRFSVNDDAGNVLNIVYNGTKPDNFSDGVIVIIQGTLTEENPPTLQADKLQTRCPSKYEGADMKDYDSKSHTKYLNEPAKKE